MSPLQSIVAYALGALIAGAMIMLVRSLPLEFQGSIGLLLGFLAGLAGGWFSRDEPTENHQ